MSDTSILTSMNTTELARLLYGSALQESDRPSAEQVRGAVRARLGACGGDRSACLAEIAQEAGDHPDAYLARMRWAIAAVARAYGRPSAPRDTARGTSRGTPREPTCA
ncbi:hypothetical protein [Actinomadura sp. WAC 06369]|uniref:hypothetical protein n=1 Tax=Actinomadura sp. WAC 06369 TaxID=2203193 RepID=UPI000F789DB2|nr:hypothetical protein [Actinomadura sp. WAC 06369]RSN45376.1 hypothetical protein DMH08_36725 [Actinomadura sp. WAC 06369]